MILGESFYTVNTQNFQEFKRICKGQKSITQGFLEINVARFARKDETFCEVFNHYENLELNFARFARVISVYQ